MLAWPVAGAILVLGLLAAALDPVVPQAAELVAAANGWLAAYLAAVARLVASLPLAEARSGPALLLLALAGGGVVGSGPPPSRSRRPLLAAVAIAIAGVGLWRLVPAGEALPPPAGLRVTALDVGQGDAILVEAPGRPCSSTRGHRRVAPRTSSDGVGCAGSRCSSSRIPSETTSAAPAT